MNLKQSAILVSLISAIGALPVRAEPGGVNLSVEVTGLRSDAGVVRCDLYRTGKGFPGKTGNAELHVSGQPQGGRATCVFGGVNPGELAVAVMHDEDSDGKMKANFIGIPQEGWAVSRNAPARSFGPPRYEDAKFAIQAAEKIELRMNY